LIVEDRDDSLESEGPEVSSDEEKEDFEGVQGNLNVVKSMNLINEEELKQNEVTASKSLMEMIEMRRIIHKQQ
jgi:hypothetical protein